MALSNLLSSVYEYNQHFVAMLNVINKAKLNPPMKGHKHHIIPKCWYKMNGLDVDNSEENLVLLTYEDHVKVHKLAILCGITPKFRSKLAFAFHKLTQGEVYDSSLWTGENHPMFGKKHTNFTKEKMSKSHKNYIFTENHKKHLSECKIGKPHPCKMSEENRERNRNRYKNKTWKLVNGKRIWLEREDA